MGQPGDYFHCCHATWMSETAVGVVVRKAMSEKMKNGQFLEKAVVDKVERRVDILTMN